MYQGGVLNEIAKEFKYDKYLEVGCAKGFTIDIVRYPKYRVGVDPIAPEESKDGIIFFKGTSDEFFLQNKDIFDLVFIDGMHWVEYVFADFYNSYNFTRKGGLITLHDVLPFHDLSGRSITDKSKEWCGDTYKVMGIIKTFYPQLPIFIVPDVIPALAMIPKLTDDRLTLPTKLVRVEDADWDKFYSWATDNTTLCTWVDAIKLLRGLFSGEVKYEIRDR